MRALILALLVLACSGGEPHDERVAVSTEAACSGPPTNLFIKYTVLPISYTGPCVRPLSGQYVAPAWRPPAVKDGVSPKLRCHWVEPRYNPCVIPEEVVGEYYCPPGSPVQGAVYDYQDRIHIKLRPDGVLWDGLLYRSERARGSLAVCEKTWAIRAQLVEGPAVWPL